MDFTFVPVSNFVQADSQQPNTQANGVFIAPAAAGLLAWQAPIGVVTSGAITAQIGAAQVITLTQVGGTTNNVTWRLAVGQTVVLEPNTVNQEAFVITAVFPATNQVQGIIRTNHTPGGSGGIAATAFFLDQARSALAADGVPGNGVQLVALAALDPVTGNRYSARAAGADGVPAVNATIVSTGLVNNIGTLDRLRTDGAGRIPSSDQDLLAQILIELRALHLTLAEGLSTNTDPDDYRATVLSDYPLN